MILDKTGFQGNDDQLLICLEADSKMKMIT